MRTLQLHRKLLSGIDCTTIWLIKYLMYRFSRTRFGKSIHSLRHTWTSNAIKAGINPKIVQEQLGHTSVKTTLDIYTEISLEQKIDALERMIEKPKESE